MFEPLTNPRAAAHHPGELFILTFIVTSFALLVSAFIFDTYTGISSVVLVTVSFIPLVYHAFIREEADDKTLPTETQRFKHHKSIVTLFLFLFLGCLFAYFLWYAVLPPSLSTSLFDIQLQTVADASTITSNAIAPGTAFSYIVTKNFTVLFFCIILSFFFGIGALYLLIWNASVVAISMGTSLFSHVAAGGNTPLGALFSMLRYLPHGIPEMISFFLGSLGAGVIAIAFLKHDLHGALGKRILTDGTFLILFASALLVVSALIEVFITPLVIP